MYRATFFHTRPIINLSSSYQDVVRKFILKCNKIEAKKQRTFFILLFHTSNHTYRQFGRIKVWLRLCGLDAANRNLVRPIVNRINNPQVIAVIFSLRGYFNPPVISSIPGNIPFPKRKQHHRGGRSLFPRNPIFELEKNNMIFIKNPFTLLRVLCIKM